MRILIDECVHKKLAQALRSHEVRTVQEAGWRGVKNGKLLRLASKEYDVFLTSDKNLEYQQHTGSLSLPVITISTQGNMWEDIEPVIPRIVTLLSSPLSIKFYRIE
jgi:predicted nuclease of predicted toxin-antitoxin system